MKIKTSKIIISIVLIIILSVLSVIAYYLILDIESKAPKKIIKESNIETYEFMGRKVFVMSPKNAKITDKVILYFHGGSYVAEATKNHWNFLEKIANDTGATVIMPDYPLTPKYTYKDVFKMAGPLYKEITDRIDVEKDLILMGDSAGGGLSLALLEKMSAENEKMPQKTILISPWLDVRLENQKINEIQKYDTQLSKEKLKLAGIAYAGEDGINNYLVNPIEGDLSRLKNVTIYTGTYDILNPDVHLLQEKAKKQGTIIEVKEYKEAKHIWIIENNSDNDLKEKAYSEIIKDITID